MKLFNKCILLFILLLLFGCSNKLQQSDGNERNSEKLKRPRNEYELVLTDDELDYIENLFEVEFKKDFTILDYYGPKKSMPEFDYFTVDVVAEDNLENPFEAIIYFDDWKIEELTEWTYNRMNFIKRCTILYRNLFDELIDTGYILTVVPEHNNQFNYDITDEALLEFSMKDIIINIAIEQSSDEELNELLTNLGKILQEYSTENNLIYFRLYIVSDLSIIKDESELTYRLRHGGESYDVYESIPEYERFDFIKMYTNYLNGEYFKEMKENTTNYFTAF